MADKLHIEVVTAERRVFVDEVDMVVAPGAEGQLGILPHHAPLMTMLAPGEVRLKKDGEEVIMATSGGFLEVLANRVTILADTAERIEEIDIARAEEAKQRAEERLAMRGADVDRARAQVALARALVRIKIARRRRPAQERMERDRGGP